MTKTVAITMARQLGSGGSCIAQQVAKRLGYAFIDRQILEQAAKVLEIEESEVESREGRLQSFWEKWVSGFAMGAPCTLYPAPLRWVSDEHLEQIERRLVTELAVKGNCVVLGRGGFHVLRGKVRLVNVMVHAPLEFRVERVMNIYHARNKTEAAHLIERSDHDRRRYVRAFTGRDWFDCRNYHLTIDTGKIDFASAGEMIVSFARQLPVNDAWPWVNEPF